MPIIVESKVLFQREPPPMGLDRYVNTFNRYLRDRFGERVARISFDTGVPCPWGKCVFCDNRVFVPSTAIVPEGDGWEARFAAQKERAAARYGARKFIAYFQSGTSTAGDPERLGAMYRRAARLDGVAGLSISTRPDHVSEDIVRRIVEAVPSPDTDIWMEIGLQSIHPRSLAFLNRGHDAAGYDRAVETIHRAGGRIKVSAHLIAAIPGETTDDLRETIRRATDHPAVRGVKIHHLQVYRETPLAALFEREPFALPGEEEYIALLGDIIRVLPPRIVVMRLFTDAPDDRLLAPRWRSGTQELLRKLEEHCEKHTIFQGNDGAMA